MFFMINSPIDLNTESGDPHFENDTMVAVKSNNLKHNTMIGSYVIIPKSEVSSPFDLTDKEWSDSRELLLKVKKYIDETYKPDGYNIGWNVGAVAGQSVAHAHMHIIPRYADEPLAGKGIRSWFKQPENIRASLKDNK
jgi:histidine triad (HIT) family protein